ncbi:unnamed protein product [Paramecium sonneborni]|uniref:VPS10 domain-containing protein n=1 Tax=Paramecium sonneborni TaxID=65129 RepID=A0A8S1NSC8_9CILI|nr:unnamed protein product [Paramecium sonneborni]
MANNRELKKLLVDYQTKSLRKEAHHIYKSNGTVWNQIEGLFEDIQISPADSSVLYLFGQQGQRSSRTNDCGENFEEFFTDGYYQFILNKRSWKIMLAFKKQQCEHFDLDCREPYNNQLFYSKDGAITWLPSFKNCKEALQDKFIGFINVPFERSIVLFFNENQIKLIYSVDFTNYHTLMNGVLGFYQTSKYLFILAPSNNNGGYSLHSSHSKLEEFQKKLIELPLQIYLKEYLYTVLDDENGRIYISVSHQQQEQSKTNIYISNQIGKDFQMVLTNNVRSLQNGNSDFENCRDQPQLILQIYMIQVIKRINQQSLVVMEELNGNPQKLQNMILKETYQNNRFLQLNNIYNKFSTWYNFRNWKDWIIYDIRTKYIYVLTRGQSWIEVRKRPHVFEIADCEGVIVMAKDYEPTNEIIYSIGYGKTWKTKIIYHDFFMAQNIVTETTGTARDFLIHGNTKGEGIILKLDFRDIFSKDCNFKLDCDISNSQYFDGSRTKYYRKKLNQECFNPKDMIKNKIIEPCPCQREDWICATGYSSQLEGGDCLPIGNIFNQCQFGTTYIKSQGYIKLTQCEGGLDLDSIETQCPKPFSFYQVLLFLIIILFLVFLIFFGYVLI